MFVRAINGGGIGGESGEMQVLCPSLSKHQQTSARQRVELAQGLAARSAESDLRLLKRVIGANASVVTVAKLFICFARVSLRVHLRAIAAKSQVSETPAAFRRP